MATSTHNQTKKGESHGHIIFASNQSNSNHNGRAETEKKKEIRKKK